MKVKRTDDLLIHLDQMKQNEIEENTGQTKARDFFRGSEVGNCSNQINFRRRGTPIKEIGMSKARFLDDGHLHQAVLSAELKKAGMKVVGEEEETTEIVNWKGTKFKIIAHRDGGVYISKSLELLEVKSVKEEKFQEILKTEDVSAYYAQIQLYLVLYRLGKCKLIVVDRNNSLRQEFTIEKDKSYLVQLMDKLAQIERDLKAKKPSSKDYPRNSRECGWCPYFEACWGVARGAYFKGEKAEKAVEIDGKKELKTWEVAIDLYHKYSRLKKEAAGYKAESDSLMEMLLSRFKATKIYGEGGSVSKSVSSKQVPDKSIIKELVIKGVIPFTTAETVSLKYNVGKTEEGEDE